MATIKPRTRWLVLAFVAGFVLGVVATICVAIPATWLYVHKSITESELLLAPDKRYQAAKSAPLEATDPYSRWVRLGDAAMASLEKGNIEEAEKYAKELLLRAEAHRDDWNYGNAIHKGNIVLGRIALRNSNHWRRAGVSQPISVHAQAQVLPYNFRLKLTIGRTVSIIVATVRS